MNLFKTSINSYDQCALKNAVPVQLCFSCLSFLDNITVSYNSLLKGNETTPGPKSKVIQCADKYLNQDGLNIVEMIFSHAQQIWKKAYCETCFDRSKDNIPKFEDVQEFEDRDRSFQNCVESNKKKNPCESCSPQYENLNREYKLLEDVRDGKICFDIQDKMNRSRSHWSKDLKCCKKEVSFEPFILASSFVLSLPLFFYLGCYLYTRRLESRNRTMNLIHNTDNSDNSQRTTQDHPRKEEPDFQSNKSADVIETSNDEDILYKPPRKSSKKNSTDNVDPVAGPSHNYQETNKTNTEKTILPLGNLMDFKPNDDEILNISGTKPSDDVQDLKLF
ncbi:OSTM1 family protein [Megaselia abdita]